MSRKALSGAAAFGVTALFLWLALRHVEFAKLREALAEARWWWLLPMALISLFDLLVRAARWRVLLARARAEPAPVWELLKLEAIGLAVNNVLFLRLGELARAGLASRKLGIPLAAAFASVAIERALDVAALLTIFLGAGALVPGIVPLAVTRGAQLLLSSAVGALVVLAAAESSLAEGGLLERFLRRWPRLHAFVEQLALGAVVLRSPTAAAKAAALSLALWSVDAALYWAGAFTLGLQDVMDFPRAILTLSWAGAASALPAAPGSIGTFEASVASVVGKFGAAPHAALAYALLTHMLMYLVVTITGLVFLSREGVSLASLREEAARK